MKTCYCCNEPLEHSHTIVFDGHEKCFVCDACYHKIREHVAHTDIDHDYEFDMTWTGYYAQSPARNGLYDVVTTNGERWLAAYDTRTKTWDVDNVLLWKERD